MRYVNNQFHKWLTIKTVMDDYSWLFISNKLDMTKFSGPKLVWQYQVYAIYQEGSFSTIFILICLSLSFCYTKLEW